jgi:hypothetical protein
MLARLPRERLSQFSAVVIGRQKRTPSEALTGTVVIKPIKGTRPGRQPSRPPDRRGASAAAEAEP